MGLMFARGTKEKEVITKEQIFNNTNLHKMFLGDLAISEENSKILHKIMWDLQILINTPSSFGDNSDMFTNSVNGARIAIKCLDSLTKISESDKLSVVIATLLYGIEGTDDLIINFAGKDKVLQMLSPRVGMKDYYFIPRDLYIKK
jgi:hypothetical protein